MANAKTASKTGTGSTSKKVTIAEMRDRLNKITDSYNELVTVHSCKTKRLESIEAAAMLIGRTVEQNPFLANGFYEPLVKMIIGMPCMELTPESVTKSVKELKTVYSLNRAQQARWMRAQVDIDGKPIYTENEIAAIGDSKDLDPEKITAAFYVLKEAILDANYESLEEYTAFYGPKYASMFTLFLRSPSKYIDIIYEHGVNMCLDVLEHNMINNTDVDYVPNPGSMVNQNLDVNGPGLVPESAEQVVQPPSPTESLNPPEPLIKGVQLKSTVMAEHIKVYLETEDLLTERFCALNTNPYNFFVCSVLESALNMLQEHRNKYMTSEFGENKNMRTNSPGNETPINTESAWFKADADTVMRKIEAVFADKKKGKKKDKKKGKKKNK